MDSSLLLALGVESDPRRRAAAVAQYLPMIAAPGRMLDQLGDLDADLDKSDRLQQVLHSLCFCWQYVEFELREAAGLGKN